MKQLITKWQAMLHNVPAYYGGRSEGYVNAFEVCIKELFEAYDVKIKLIDDAMAYHTKRMTELDSDKQMQNYHNLVKIGLSSAKQIFEEN